MTYGVTPMGPHPWYAAERCTGSDKATDSLITPPVQIGDACRDATGGIPWFVLDIPRPPSVNRFVRKLGNASPNVRQWARNADKYLLLRKPYPKFKGPYEVSITYPQSEFGRFDAENCQKALSDWMESVELIENDRWCRLMVIGFGEAPLGCRVKIRPWVD